MKDINRKKSDYKTSSQSYIDRSNGEEETSERSLLLLDNLEWLTTAEAAYYLRKSSQRLDKWYVEDNYVPGNFIDACTLKK
jgi:hypothetical protein